MNTWKMAAAALLVASAATVVWAAESRNKVGGGYIIYPAAKDGSQGPVVFSHLAHGEAGAGFKCADCHPGILPMKLRAVTMADINAGKGCGKCHDGQTKAPKSKGVAVAVKACGGCHMPDKEIEMKTRGPGKVLFSHSEHTGVFQEEKSVEKGGFACVDCHPKPFEAKAGAPIGMKFPHAGTGCATCHDGKKSGPSGATAKASTQCRMCHKEP